MIQLSEILDEMGKPRKVRHSYGVVAYLLNPFRVLLAHPGGPFSSHKMSNWSIPKGGASGAEDGWDAAIREFKEETGLDLPENIRERDTINLGTIQQKGGKIVRAWAVKMDDDDISKFKSNTFLFAWPDHKTEEYPEIDEVRYFTYRDAAKYLRVEQFTLIKRLADDLRRRTGEREE
jgi:predicted NUDIX family NTP pyrophosphohydrolase